MWSMLLIFKTFLGALGVLTVKKTHPLDKPFNASLIPSDTPTSLGSGLTACSLTQQPAVGAAGSVQWTFTGSLAPSAQLSVSYQVKVNN